MQIDNISHEIIQELEEKYFQGDYPSGTLRDRIVTLCNNNPKSNAQNIDLPLFILIRKGDKSLGYLFHIPLSLDLLQNKSPEEMIKKEAKTKISNLDEIYSVSQFLKDKVISLTQSKSSDESIQSEIV